MAPAWLRRFCHIITPSPPVAVSPPEPDPDHEAKLAKNREQRDVADAQLKLARRITKPLADTARELTTAGRRNHFSENLERMLQQGYGHQPRGENR